MQVKEYFFSTKNLGRLAKNLGINLELDETDKENIIGCSVILKRVMPEIWNKYKDDAGKHPIKKVIPYLNKKSLEMSKDLYERRGKQTTRSVSQIAVDRENEVYGQQRNRVVKHPQATRMPHRQPKEASGLGAMDSDFGTSGGFAGYADFNTGDNLAGPQPFFTAGGSLGGNFQSNINQNEFYDAGKKKSEASDEIQLKLARAQQEMQSYGMGGMMGGHGMQGGMQGGMMGGPGMQDMQNFGYMASPNGKQMNTDQYNPYGQNRPQDINFCIDGGDTRPGACKRDEDGKPVYGKFGSYGNDFSNGDMGNYGGLNNGMENNYEMFMGGGDNNMNDNNMMQMMQMMNMNSKNNNDNGNSNGGNNNSNFNMEQMMNMFQTMMMNTINNQNSSNSSNGMNSMNFNNMGMETDMYSQKSNEFKKSIANKLGLDPQSLLNLSSGEIEKMIKEKKKDKKKYASSNSGSDSGSDSDSERNKKSKNKVSLIEKIQELAKIKGKNLEKLKKHQKKNNSDSDSDSNSDSDSESDNESESDKKKKNIKKNINEKNKTNKKKNDSDSESDSDSKTEKSKKKKQTDIQTKEQQKPTMLKPIIKTKQNPPIVQKKTTTIVKSDSDGDEPTIEITKVITKKEELISKQMMIDSSKMEKNPKYYNDYMINFVENYKNLINDNNKYISGIKRITLEKIDLKFAPQITDSTNSFSIYYNEDIDIVLSAGEYQLNELLEGFNENYESEGCGIVIKNKDGFITIKQNDNEVFDLDCTENNSIGFLLGFDKKKYSGSSRYTAEKHHAFNNEQPIYMYITNLNQHEPFAKINPNGTFEQYIKDFATPLKLEYFVVQFRYNDRIDDDDDDNDKDLVNLGNMAHKFSLKLDVAKI
jgi:hypothetical protein